MRVSAWIGLAAAAAALVLCVAASAGSGARPAGAAARAWGVKVLLAGAFDGAFSYPADGPVVRAASVTASVSASSGAQASATASAPAEPTTAAPLSRPLAVTPPLGRSGYVFPVFGPDGTADTYGSARADVPGSWHHGDDLFAPPGTPVLAVVHGVVFSVGWNEVGGWRLWLRDDAGNEFYYAHLSAYSPLAVDGAIVQAGDVLAFVGSSGDAEGTPPHLHFEVHPVGLLSLGYDGAVDPTSYLATWRRATRVRFDPASEWTPPAPGADASKAGAVLLQSSDISSASGLDPASFARVLLGTPAIGR